MIPNIAQSIDDIIKNATPEQKVLWQAIRQITGENAAIQQLNYIGTIAGSEFLTYSANKLYLSLELKFGSGAISAGAAGVQLYNPVNIVSFICGDNSIAWNATGAVMNYISNIIEVKNIIFSRLVAGNYIYMSFTGFKIIY